MERKLIPVPPKILIIALGIFSFLSFLAFLIGKGMLMGNSIESGKMLYKVNCTFTEDRKGQANELFEQLQSENFEPELMTTKDYTTEEKGFIVALTYEGPSKELLARQTAKVLEVNGLQGSIFSPEVQPGVTKIRAGDVFPDEKSAKKHCLKVQDKTDIKFIVEPNIVVTGEQKLFLVTLKTKDPFIAEDYKGLLQQKGFSPEVISEKL